MSTPSAVQETTPSVPTQTADGNTTASTSASTTIGANDTTSTSTATSATPERKTLIVNMSQDATEDDLRALFKSDDLPEGSVTSVVKEGSNNWFVTFSNGDRALDAFKHANSVNVTVRFKTVSSFVAPSSPSHNSGHHMHHHGQTPYYGFVPVQSQEYQYWEQHSYPQDAANGHFYGRDRRGAQPRYSYAPQQTGTVHTGATSASHGHASSGAASAQGGRHPSNKSKGPRQSSSTSATSPNRHNSASSPTSTSEGQGTGAAGQNASGLRGAGRPSAPRSNTSGPAHASGNASQVGRRGPSGASGQQGATERRGNRTTSGNASNSSSSQTQQHNQHKSSAQDKASLTLTNFPPLPSGGASKSASRSSDGYGETPFTQYSRETILSVIANHDASSIKRPDFDNADAPILLTSAQTDLEINKPLPVGAKFEPLATDKRTRSLSKNRDTPSQPTAAQIVAAAASKPQTSTVKVSGASPTATPKTTTSPNDAPKKDERSKQEKAPKTAAKEEKAPKNNANNGSAANNTAASTHQPAVLSWADRAKAGKTAPIPVAAKETKEAKATTTPAPAASIPSPTPPVASAPTEAAPVPTEAAPVPAEATPVQTNAEELSIPVTAAPATEEESPAPSAPAEQN